MIGGLDVLVVVCQGWIVGGVGGVGGVDGVGPSVSVGCWRWWKLQRTWLMGRRQKRVSYQGGESSGG